MFFLRIKECLSRMPREVSSVQLNLLDSHDTPRFLTLSKGDTRILKVETEFHFLSSVRLSWIVMYAVLLSHKIVNVDIKCMKRG